MDVKEFRIGNLYDQFGDVAEVSWVTIRDLCYGAEEQMWCKPIPLTEEWLFRFGFFKFNNAWVLKEPGNPMIHEFSIWEDLSYNTGELMPDITYVHQLQNLYYVLMNKELILKDEQ